MRLETQGRLLVRWAVLKLAASSEAAPEKVGTDAALAQLQKLQGSCFQDAPVGFLRLGYRRSKVERLEPVNANVNGDRGGAMRETNLEQQPREVGSDANCCEGMWKQIEVPLAMMMVEILSKLHCPLPHVHT